MESVNLFFDSECELNKDYKNFFCVATIYNGEIDSLFHWLEHYAQKGIYKVLIISKLLLDEKIKKELRRFTNNYNENIIHWAQLHIPDKSSNYRIILDSLKKIQLNSEWTLIGSINDLYMGDFERMVHREGDKVAAFRVLRDKRSDPNQKMDKDDFSYIIKNDLDFHTSPNVTPAKIFPPRGTYTREAHPDETTIVSLKSQLKPASRVVQK